MHVLVSREASSDRSVDSAAMSRFRVDLRSDTVTKPSEAMRRAMADAEVGDDWYDDDPTVNRLQERCAEAVGKEAGAFLPTGTMANQIGLRLHFSGPGHLVAAAAGLHVTSVEVMTAAALAGIAYRTVDPGPRGWIDAEQAAMLLEPDEFYDVEVVDLLAVENTVGAAGGRVMPIEELRAVRKVAADANVPIHLDGARIFNAAAAAGVDAAEIAGEVDTVMFCLSKGLGAPIGSVVCGPADMAREARRLKILYGGAWRQAGVVAAAGLVALEEGPTRLHEDHERARRLAEGVAELLPGSIDLEQVETNMVFVDTEAVGLPLFDTLERLGTLGVGATHSGGKARMVTHLDVDDAGIGVALDAWRDLAAERGSGGSSSERSARA
jgi:threonine aldolase